MSPRRSWRLAASLLSVMVVPVAALPALPASAQAPATAQVVIDAVGTDGIDGLAILGPAADGGTDVQILVSQAPADTFAVVHAGTCDAIDATPVALLGDVSATSQVRVANAFESLADGGHVLALHAGLDLAASVGCGAIPEVVGAPARTPQPTADGGSYTGSVTGFTIAWPAAWAPYDVVQVEGEDRVGLLQDGGTSVLVAVSRQPGADPRACVRDARQGLFDRLDQGTLEDLAPLSADDGSTIAGVETGRAWLAYRYHSIEEAGDFDVADYLECRTAGDLLVSILHRSTPETYADDAAAREELLAGMTFPSTPVPVVPTPTPAAPPDAACDGYEAWHDGTLDRVDQLARLKSDVDEATNDAALAFDLTEYKLTLKRAVRELAQMRTAQEGETAPEAAQEAQAVAVEMFGAYEDAAQVLSDYYETSTDRATLERANRAKSAADKLEDELTDALVGVEATCD